MAYYYSKSESDLIGINILRNKEILDNLDIIDLKNEIFRHDIDMCRLKIDVSDYDLFKQLDRLGLAYNIFTINTQFEHQVKDINYLDGMDSKLSIQLVSESNQSLFKEVIAQIMDTKSWTNFSYPLFDYFIDEEIQRNLAINYFYSFGNGKDGNLAWLLFEGTNCVGTFMGRKNDEGKFYGTLYGIIEKYRSKGFSKAIYSFMLNECKKENLSAFINEIHIQNRNSLNSALHSGLKPIRTFFNINLFPLLNLQKNDSRTLINEDVRSTKYFMKESNIATFEQYSHLRLNDGSSVQLTYFVKTLDNSILGCKYEFIN